MIVKVNPTSVTETYKLLQKKKIQKENEKPKIN